MANAVTNIALATTSARHLTDEQKVKLQKATREFESIFVQMMLKSMRSAQGEESSEFGGESYGGGVMKDLFDTELSKHIGKQGKLGVAESLYRKLTGESLPAPRVSGASAATGASQASGAAKTHAADHRTASASRAARTIQQLNEFADDSTSGVGVEGDEAETALLSLTSAMERLQDASATDPTNIQNVPATATAMLKAAFQAKDAAAQGEWTSTAIRAQDMALPPTTLTQQPAKAALTASAGIITSATSKRDASSTTAATAKSTSAAFDRVKSYDAIIARTADTVGVDANLLKAMIVEESGGKQHARSSKNAKGLMQLIDTTAESMGVKNVWDPHQNIQGGARYLKQQLEKFNGDVPLALASYNAGPGNVAKYNGIPPFRETQNYVKRVMNLFTAFQSMERNSDDVIK